MAFALTTSALAAQPTIVWMDQDGSLEDIQKSRKAAATPINAVNRPHNGFHVQDERSGKHFLVDTGAFLSIFPATQTDRRAAANDLQKLVAANGTLINLRFQRHRHTPRQVHLLMEFPHCGCDTVTIQR